EFMYEMTLQCLLPPGANGVPNFNPQQPGERMMVKLPKQFKEFFGTPTQIDEDLGGKLATWAAGGAKPAPERDTLIVDFANCTTDKELMALENRRAAAWTKPMPAGYKQRVKDASDAAIERVAGGTADPSADAATWSATLAGAQSVEQLTQAWESCSQAFGGMPPVECD